MTTSNSRSAYNPEYEVMDRALRSKKGLRVEFFKRSSANYYRLRLHTARQLDRALNSEAREPGDPGYGLSEYDGLIVQVKRIDQKWWVYIKRSVLPNKIEEIPDDGQQGEGGEEYDDGADVRRGSSGSSDSDTVRRLTRPRLHSR